MKGFIVRKQARTVKRIAACLIIVSFVVNSILPPALYAQMQVTHTPLPPPGTMIGLSPGFVPAIVKGLSIDPENPLHFNFILDTGSADPQGEALRQESMKLIKYFLASLTVPENELWVNLSPYEKDRIVPDAFGVTGMGRDMLAQDYLLKQLTASLIHPEESLGKEFWKRIREKVHSAYGTHDLPVNTFNKVWVVPDRAQLYENNGSVFIVESRLKVMLEEDYAALNHQAAIAPGGEASASLSAMQSEILREVILPEIEREVNEGKTFANLRQIYHSMILAAWYKMSMKDSLLGRLYVDQGKVRGIDVEDDQTKERIYAQYLEAFKKGVYDFIREEQDPATQEWIPRKYFSGGITAMNGDMAMSAIIRRDLIRGDATGRSQQTGTALGRSAQPAGRFALVSWSALEATEDNAVIVNGVKTPEAKWVKERAEEILQSGVQQKHIDEIIAIGEKIFQAEPQWMDQVRQRLALAQTADTHVLGTTYMAPDAQREVARLIRLEAFWHAVDLMKMRGDDKTFEMLSQLRHRLKHLSTMILSRLMLESETLPIVRTDEIGEGDMIALFDVNIHIAPRMFMTPPTLHTSNHFTDFRNKQVFLLAASKATRQKLGITDSVKPDQAMLGELTDAERAQVEAAGRRFPQIVVTETAKQLTQLHLRGALKRVEDILARNLSNEVKMQEISYLFTDLYQRTGKEEIEEIIALLARKSGIDQLTASDLKKITAAIKDTADVFAKRIFEKTAQDLNIILMVRVSEGFGRDEVAESLKANEVIVPAQLRGSIDQIYIAINEGRGYFRDAAGNIYPIVNAIIDVIEGTNMFVTNSGNKTVEAIEPFESGSTSVIVTGPGVADLGNAPDGYVGQFLTNLGEHAEEFKRRRVPINGHGHSLRDPELYAAYPEKIIEYLKFLAEIREVPLEALEEEIVVMDRKRESQFLQVLAGLQESIPGLRVTTIQDGTVAHGLKAVLSADTFTRVTGRAYGPHKTVITIGGSAEGFMNLAIAGGLKSEGAVGGLRVYSAKMNKDSSGVEVLDHSQRYSFTAEERTDIGDLRDDAAKILNGNKLFVEDDIKRDVSGSFSFISTNGVFHQPGVEQQDDGLAVKVLNIHAADGDVSVSIDAAMAAQAPKRILIVEDETSIGQLYLRLLSRWGYEAVYVTDIESAKQELAGGAFDLVLSDIRDRADRETGLELADIVIGNYPGTKIKLMSGYFTGEPSALVRSSNRYFGVLDKPASREQLMTAVEEAIGPSEGAEMTDGAMIAENSGLTLSEFEEDMRQSLDEITSISIYFNDQPLRLDGRAESDLVDRILGALTDSGVLRTDRLTYGFDLESDPLVLDVWAVDTSMAADEFSVRDRDGQRREVTVKRGKLVDAATGEKVEPQRGSAGNILDGERRPIKGSNRGFDYDGSDEAMEASITDEILKLYEDDIRTLAKEAVNYGSRDHRADQRRWFFQGELKRERVMLGLLRSWRSGDLAPELRAKTVDKLPEIIQLAESLLADAGNETISIDLARMEAVIQSRLTAEEADHLRRIGTDEAMTGEVTPPGGIDMNPALLDMQIRRDGNGIPLPVEMQPIEQMTIDGFVPVIINIAPIVNLPLLLGIADDLPADAADRPKEFARRG